MITPRENLFRVLRHEMPEWIPISGHVDPYNQPHRDGMDPALAEKLRTVSWSDESTVAFSRYLGLDIMDWYGRRPCRSVRRRVVSERRQEGDDTIVIWHTPQGDLQETIRRCRADGTSYRVEHLLKSAKDIPALAAIFEDESFEVDEEALSALKHRIKLIGDDGILMMALPGTPLGMLVRVYAGVATTAYLHADAPAALEELFATMEDNYRRLLSAIVSTGADAFVTVDDTSTTTISPTMFERYCISYTNRMADIVHAAGKFYFHHSCGLIRDLLPLYRQTKMDAVHAFTIPPIGNTTVREGKRVLGPGVVIIATLVQLFNSMDDWASVQRSLREMFDGAAPGDNFILTLTADPNKTMADTRRLLEECRRYQRLI